MICHGMTDKQTDWLTDGHKHIDWRTDDKTTNEEDDEIVVADVVVVAAVVVANVVVVVVVVEIVVVEILQCMHCRNGTGATGQAFCVLARGRLMWYVYHVIVRICCSHVGGYVLLALVRLCSIACTGLVYKGIGYPIYIHLFLSLARTAACAFNINNWPTIIIVVTYCCTQFQSQLLLVVP